MRGAMREVGTFVVVVILLLTGAWGILESVDDFPQADTLGKMVYTVLLATFGCLGLGAGATVLARKPWAKVLIQGWAVTLLATSLIAVFVWPWSGIVPFLGMVSLVLLITSTTYLLWKSAARSQEQ